MKNRQKAYRAEWKGTTKVPEWVIPFPVYLHENPQLSSQ